MSERDSSLKDFVKKDTDHWHVLFTGFITGFKKDPKFFVFDVETFNRNTFRKRAKKIINPYMVRSRYISDFLEKYLFCST